MAGQESANTEAAGASARGLRDRAQRLLAAGDTTGFGALFGELRPAPDRNDRASAGLALVETGLQALAERPSEQLALELAGGAVALLAGDPAEPVLLGRAARIFLTLGCPQVAGELSSAARRLQPGWLDDGPPIAPVAAGPPEERLRALAGRARAVAAEARPAAGLRISLCMIARDEEAMLAQCLAAAVDAVDEIVLVDTGSTDRTVEIAESYGALVIHQPWRDSFADARNVSLAAAGGDWLLYLDADEVLAPADAGLLRELAGRTWREGFRFRVVNHTGAEAGGTAIVHEALRMFRNRPGYRFSGRVHEQIEACLPAGAPARVESAAVHIEHHGYLAGVRSRRQKSARNVELLERDLAERGATAFTHYNLGAEYAASGDAPGAHLCFERGWALLEALPDLSGHEFAPALMRGLVQALNACARPVDAFVQAQEGLERFPGFTDLVLEQALASVSLGQIELACELLEGCLEMGDAPSRYTPALGCGSFLARVHLAELCHERGDLDRAVELLEASLLERPGYLAAVAPLASALLSRGVEPEALHATMAAHLGECTPMTRLALAGVLREHGELDAAATELRAVLDALPGCTAARLALGEILLAQRRHRDSAALLAEIPADDAAARQGLRCELLALLAGEQLEGFEAALERARDAGLARAEVTLFGAWRELQGGTAPEEPLPQGAIPRLSAMLEALLRAHDFGAFERLLELFEYTPRAPRERRQMLAEMYLRNGFAASSAQEWMAVCNEQPDAEALVGLARVAVLRAMPEEAGEFAVAALSHDPDNEAAKRLLSQARAASG